MTKTALLVCAFALAACGGKAKSGETTPAADQRSLYERLGGEPAITAVVHDFCVTTKADPRISMFFANADEPRLEKLMVEQICEATGGPCHYSGKTMKDSHATMKVGEAAFAAFIDDLTKTLDKFKVGPREKQEVLSSFNAMKADVVTVP
ncbi:MAG TPA: group 1 truncated hemoglobin [Kofleriaceae bacterium]|jgi:hemoglobin